MTASLSDNKFCVFAIISTMYLNAGHTDARLTVFISAFLSNKCFPCLFSLEFYVFISYSKKTTHEALIFIFQEFLLCCSAWGPYQ